MPLAKLLLTTNFNFLWSISLFFLKLYKVDNQHLIVVIWDLCVNWDRYLRMTVTVRYGELLTLWQSSVDLDVKAGLLSTLWKIICWLANTRGLIRLAAWRWKNQGSEGSLEWGRICKANDSIPWLPTSEYWLCKDWFLCQQWSFLWKWQSFNCLTNLGAIWGYDNRGSQEWICPTIHGPFCAPQSLDIFQLWPCLPENFCFNMVNQYCFGWLPQ